MGISSGSLEMAADKAENRSQASDDSAHTGLRQGLTDTDHALALKLMRGDGHKAQQPGQLPPKVDFSHQIGVAPLPPKDWQVPDSGPSPTLQPWPDKLHVGQPLPALKYYSGALPRAFCPESQTYKEFIQDAARRMYQPKLLGNVPALLRKHTCDAMTVEDSIARANEELQATGDHYNSVIPPAKTRAMKRTMAEEDDHGSGIRFQSFVIKEPDHKIKFDGEFKPVVSEVVKGSPADQGGLQPGDYVVKLNDTDTSKMHGAKVIDAIRDAAGDKIDLTLIRNGATIERSFNRQKVEMPSVSDPVDKGNGIFYIRIYEFTEKTAEQLQQAMEKATDAKAFVIDLRANSGGLLETSVAASEMFVKHGTIITTRKRVDSDYRHPKYGLSRYAVDSKNKLYTEWDEGTKEPKPQTGERKPYLANGRPVIALQDGNSASAAEIMLAALHDSGHATTLGEDSFGKGIIQWLRSDFPSGAAVRVTQGVYRTPKGRWLGDAHDHRHPLKPDKYVRNPKNVLLGSANDVQLSSAVDLLGKKLKGR